MTICRSLGVVILLAWSACARAQSLDWSGDVTLFGTTDNEHDPVLTIMPASGMTRAFCIARYDSVCMKVSTDNGASWSSCATLPTFAQLTRVNAAADGQFEYALVTANTSSAKTLYRFGPRENDWRAAMHCAVAPNCTGNVIASALVNDAAAGLGDPTVNACWIERAPATNHYSAWHSQSRDRGVSFQAANELFSFENPDAMAAGMDMAASWTESSERLIVAATVDRPGSIPEQIRVFTSEDQGLTWGDSTAIDDAAFAQCEPSLAAYQNTVLLVYARRINASSERDIFLSYSPDGGLSFSPPLAITDSLADEHAPNIRISSSGESFTIFYLADNGVDEPSTVLVREGMVATPWQVGSAMPISEIGGAVRDGGLCGAAGPLGMAVAWTSRFPLGDTDVKFDASWRGVRVSDQLPNLPVRIALGQNFPNPFNASTVLPLSLNRAMNARVIVIDIMGRRAMEVDAGFMGAGRHEIVLDLSNLPSGVYWSRIYGAQIQPVRMVLVK